MDFYATTDNRRSSSAEIKASRFSRWRVLLLNNWGARARARTRRRILTIAPSVVDFLLHRRRFRFECPTFAEHFSEVPKYLAVSRAAFVSWTRANGYFRNRVDNRPNWVHSRETEEEVMAYSPYVPRDSNFDFGVLREFLITFSRYRR